MAKNKPETLQSLLQEVEAFGRYRHTARELISDMLTIWVIAIRNGVEPRDADWDAREAEYMRYVEKYGREGFELFAKLLAAFMSEAKVRHGDLLGEMFMSLNLGGNLGQFFTPFEISRLMVRLTLSKEEMAAIIKEKGRLHMNEPTCGSGGMVIAKAELMRELGYDPTQHLIVTMQDVSRDCVHMSYLSAAMWQIPAYIIEGNTLALEERRVLESPALIAAKRAGAIREAA